MATNQQEITTEPQIEMKSENQPDKHEGPQWLLPAEICPV